MKVLALGVMLCAGLMLVGAADATARTARGAKAPAPQATPAPAPARVAFVPALRRVKPPALSLRPELSDGEWGAAVSNEELSSNDLAGSSITLADAEARLEAARQGAAVERLRERNLQDTSVLTNSNMTQTLRDSAPTKLEIPDGLDLSTLGLTINPGPN